MSFFCCWCKSRELGGRGSPRFPCVTPVVEKFSLDLLRAIISYWAGSHLEPVKHSVKHLRWSSSAKIANGLNTLNISAKKLHYRCSTGLQMRLRLEVL